MRRTSFPGHLEGDGEVVVEGDRVNQGVGVHLGHLLPGVQGGLDQNIAYDHGSQCIGTRGMKHNLDKT